jgi:hypothetical protein
VYAWLWRALPGSRGARAFQLVALAAVALVLLWFWAFPWASDTYSLYQFFQ